MSHCNYCGKRGASFEMCKTQEQAKLCEGAEMTADKDALLRECVKALEDGAVETQSYRADLRFRITAALEDGGWMPVENGGFIYLTTNEKDMSLRFRNFCETPANATHFKLEPPLPKGDE